MSDFMCFAGQVCVVTGAGSQNGIGFCAARRLGGKIARISTTERNHERAAELKGMGIEARVYVSLNKWSESVALLQALLL